MYQGRKHSIHTGTSSGGVCELEYSGGGGDGGSEGGAGGEGVEGGSGSCS